MALRLFLSLICFIGASTPALALRNDCFRWLEDGCGFQAYYVPEQNETRWTMNCDGNWYRGRMGGNQALALCDGGVS